MINENNYPGASITLVGYAGTDAGFPAFDKEQTGVRREFRLPINHGYKDKNTGEWKETGTTWFTITGIDDTIGHVRKGDKIRLDDAKLESREFTRKDGSIGQAFETSYGTLTVLGSANSDDDLEAPF